MGRQTLVRVTGGLGGGGFSDLITGLVAHWKLNEPNGTREDSQGSNDLSDNNTVTSATGKIGDAADFEDSAGEYLSIADNTDLSTGNIDFTLALWANLESKNVVANILASKWNTAGSFEWILEYDASPNKFGFYVSADGSTIGASVASNETVSTGTWYFIVVWHDAISNTINIQVNNNTPNSTSHSSGVFDSTASFILGGYQPADMFFYDGLIDSVSFWKRVLTDDEKTALYNSGNGLDYPF